MAHVGDGDLENILGNGDFDTCAEFTIAGQAKPLCVNGWFTDVTHQADLMSEKINAVDPKFDCATTDITNSDGTDIVKRGGSVTINGTAYTVEVKQDNGIGITTLHLKT